MAFLLAATRLGSSVQALASIIPEYQQVEPFLELTPESVSERHYLPHREFELNGDLRLDHVSFAYEGRVRNPFWTTCQFMCILASS